MLEPLEYIIEEDIIDEVTAPSKVTSHLKTDVAFTVKVSLQLSPKNVSPPTIKSPLALISPDAVMFITSK